MRAIQMEQFGDPAQVIRVVDIQDAVQHLLRGGKILLKVAGR